MADGRGGFSGHLEKELEQYSGVMVPVKASFLERHLVKRLPVSKLHPNPDDEFTWPEIGPNPGIINKYMSLYKQYGVMYRMGEQVEEPLMVQKVHPDGYMLLNGHHRWAAYWNLGVKLVPVSIINLTQETDIEKMIRESKHDRRATLDLDEVIFCRGEEPAEKPRGGIFGTRYKQKIRRGIPKLLHYLAVRGYDIWVYTAEYYSMDDIGDLFRRYFVKVDGIITGTGRKIKRNSNAKERVEHLFAAQYKQTLHIDRDMVVRTFADSKTFEDYPIEKTGSSWSQAALSVIREMEKNENG